jgi:hypothetical protein
MVFNRDGMRAKFELYEFENNGVIYSLDGHVDVERMSFFGGDFENVDFEVVSDDECTVHIDKLFVIDKGEPICMMQNEHALDLAKEWMLNNYNERL